MSEASEMYDRPAIERITFISAEGNPCVFQCIGNHRNCSEIREVMQDGEYCRIPWIEVWEDKHLLARFNQHKLEHILYTRTTE